MTTENLPSISIVMPCFNEADHIADTAQAVVRHIEKSWPGRRYELLLVNDGSTDGTEAALQDICARLQHVRVHSFPYNKGRGAALKAGFALSSCDYIIALDADLSYDVGHINEIMAVLDGDRSVDAVIVSAYMKGGLTQGVPFKRLFVSRAANWLLSGFLHHNISTVTCVVRGYKVSTLKKCPLLENGKELHLEILRKLELMEAKIVEIPGRLVWRKSRKAARRNNGLNIVTSAYGHLFYAVFTKPTKLLAFVSILVLGIGTYEGINVLRRFFMIYDPGYSADLWWCVWHGLLLAFRDSPHTVVIAVTCLLLSAQLLTLLALVSLAKFQHEELLKNLFVLYAKKNEPQSR